jgi:hypothetical protein
MLANFYQVTGSYIPEDSALQVLSLLLCVNTNTNYIHKTPSKEAISFSSPVCFMKNGGKERLFTKLFCSVILKYVNGVQLFILIIIIIICIFLSSAISYNRLLILVKRFNT